MNNKFTADKGYVFAKADKSAVYGTILILGCNDKPENYIQILEDEAAKLKEKIKAEHEAKHAELLSKKNVPNKTSNEK